MRPLRIRIVSPGGLRGPLRGNRVTAARWARILGELGHQARVEEEGKGGAGADLLIALHARKSHAAIAAFEGPVVLALTGTDLYGDVGAADPEALGSIERADRLVVLQPRALEALAPEHRRRARVIHQSTERVEAGPRGDGLSVAVVAHLRPVKDPLLTAEALRRIPPGAPVRVRHAGAALDPDLGRRARELAGLEPRYQWLGEVPREEALRLVAESHLLSLTSTMEGGANVVTEAIAVGTPVVSTRIDGSIGLLGDDYPGYVPVGDAGALAALLERAAGDPAFYRELDRRCRALAPIADPGREKRAWRELLEDLRGV